MCSLGLCYRRHHTLYAQLELAACSNCICYYVFVMSKKTSNLMSYCYLSFRFARVWINAIQICKGSPNCNGSLLRIFVSSSTSYRTTPEVSASKLCVAVTFWHSCESVRHYTQTVLHLASIFGYIERLHTSAFSTCPNF